MANCYNTYLRLSLLCVEGVPLCLTGAEGDWCRVWSGLDEVLGEGTIGVFSDSLSIGESRFSESA